MRLSEKGHTYALFAIVVITCALGSLSQTATNSMLTGICAEFFIDAGEGQWLTTVYMLVMGITVPVVTFLARRMSVKRLVCLALGLFLAGSAVDLIARTFFTLVLGRVLQAVATGITLPLVQSLAMTRFPRERTGTTMGIAGIAMGFAPNIGPIIGGALVDSWGWRSFYGLLIGALVLLALACALLVREEGDGSAGAVLDVPSLALSTLGFGGLLLAASNAANMPLSSEGVWVPALSGACCVAAFLVRQNRISHPLIYLGVFRARQYRAAFVAQNCLFASFMGITLIVPLFVQGICGLSALDAGIVFVPATVIALFLNPLAGLLTDRVGARAVTVTGAVLLVVGAASMMFVDAATPLWLLTAMQAVRALGVSTLVGPLNSWGLSGLLPANTMDGSVFFATARQVCASLGTALMMLLVVSVPASLALTGMGGAEAAVWGYRAAFALSAALSLAVLIVAVWKICSETNGSERRPWWRFFSVVKRCGWNSPRRRCSRGCPSGWTRGPASVLWARTAMASPRFCECSPATWKWTTAASSAPAVCRWACSARATAYAMGTPLNGPSWGTVPNTNGPATLGFAPLSRGCSRMWIGARRWEPFPAASVDGLIWPGCSSATGTCSCWTSLPTTWMCAPSPGSPST